MRPVYVPEFTSRGWFAPELAVEGWFDQDDTFKAATGTVSGSITSSGTIAGYEGEPGLVAGSITSSGTITGTKREGDASSTWPYDGGGTYVGPPMFTRPRPAPPEPPKKVPPQRAYGAVSGSAASTGVIRGTVAHNGSTAATARCEGRVTGLTTRTTAIRSTHAIPDHRIRGRAVSMHSHDDIRRIRDDAELLLLI